MYNYIFKQDLNVSTLDVITKTWDISPKVLEVSQNWDGSEIFKNSLFTLSDSRRASEGVRRQEV